jgi:hypothetical protein
MKDTFRRYDRRGGRFQGVVSLTVLSGVLPLSCTAVIALSMAGVLAGLG